MIDIAREHGRDSAVCVGDAALRRHMTTPDALAATVAECGRWPGIRRARGVIDLLDPLSESPLESVGRLRIHDLGLPRPQLQVNIFDLTGRFLGRVDQYWDEPGVFGEVDGKEKYGDQPRASWWAEKKRHERIEDTGLVGLRYGQAEIEDPPELARKVTSAFRRGFARPPGERAWRAVPTTPPEPWDLALADHVPY